MCDALGLDFPELGECYKRCFLFCFLFCKDCLELRFLYAIARAPCMYFSQK